MRSLHIITLFTLFMFACSYGNKSATVDAGPTPTTDSGYVAPDSGPVVVDSGPTPIIDSGPTPTVDSGTGTTTRPLVVQPSAALQAWCQDKLVLVAWGPTEEIRSAVGATSFTIPMTSGWHGWVRMTAFCPDDAAQGATPGYWWGPSLDWAPLAGQTLRQAGLTVSVVGRDVSDIGLICPLGADGYKPTFPIEVFVGFTCPPT